VLGAGRGVGFVVLIGDEGDGPFMGLNGGSVSEGVEGCGIRLRRSMKVTWYESKIRAPSRYQHL
jgi:hypothetical protein